MKTSLSISAVGDIMLGDHPVRIGHGVRSIAEQHGDIAWLFAGVRERLGSSDLVFGNLEVAHSDIGRVEGDLSSMEFRGSPRAVPGLSEAGFNLLNVANNHCLEHGLEAFEDTVRRLRECNIGVVGLRDNAGMSHPCTVTKRGVKATVLGYSLRPEEYHKGLTIPYALSHESEILREVAEAAQWSDVVIVSLHWGEEFMDCPSTQQVEFAHNLVDAGAKVILGHHPHVLQGIETYRGSVIAYSLGNFVFDMWQKETRRSVILNVSVGADGSASYELSPVYIDREYRPIPLLGARRDRALQHIEKLSQRLGLLESGARRSAVRKRTHDGGPERYLQAARRRTLLHRLGNYTYFATHLYQYRPELIKASIKRSLARRVSELPSFLLGRGGSD